MPSATRDDATEAKATVVNPTLCVYVGHGEAQGWGGGGTAKGGVLMVFASCPLSWSRLLLSWSSRRPLRASHALLELRSTLCHPFSSYAIADRRLNPSRAARVREHKSAGRVVSMVAFSSATVRSGDVHDMSLFLSIRETSPIRKRGKGYSTHGASPCSADHW